MFKFRKIDVSDKSEFIKMATDFYSSEGVLHNVSKRILLKNFDEMCNHKSILQGFIFEEDAIIAGYAAVTTSYSTEVGGKILWLEDLYVKPEFRRKGLGKNFMTYFLKNLDTDIVRIRLEATKNNQNAINMYTKIGFNNLDYLQYIYEIR